MLENTYSICVIDIGSPKAGNLGWCFTDTDGHEKTGDDIDTLFPYLQAALPKSGLILGLEAPLFVPLRKDIMEATKARRGEGQRPWSAGAGAQVLTINLPIMVYLFKGIKAACPDISWHVNEQSFTAKPNEIMIFEAFISAADKGSSHINDAELLAQSCRRYAQKKTLPSSMLEPEKDVEFLNLASAALIRCGILNDPKALHEISPIYRPSNE